MRRGGVGGREGGVGVGVKKTRYEGRQRRREAAGERFIRGDGFSRSPETERAKEKEGVREGWEGRREEKGMGGVGWSELTHCLPTAARSWIRRPFRPKEGQKRVEESEHVLDTWLHCFLT